MILFPISEKFYGLGQRFYSPSAERNGLAWLPMFMSGPGIGPVATPRRERDCESTVTTFNSSVLLAKDIALDHFQSTAVVVLDLLFSGHSSRLDSLPLFFELLPCFVSAFQSVTCGGQQMRVNLYLLI